MSHVYRFGYAWRIRGPIDVVFHYVSDARTFRDWFPVFKEVHPDDPIGPVRVGSHVMARVRALLPYTLNWDITVSRYEPPRLVETQVTVSLSGRFSMRGYVRYRFDSLADGLVLVSNEQELASNLALPEVLRRAAQGAFTFNHRYAMGRAAFPLQAIVAGATSAGS